ncbi:MAG: hypothetical protein GX494_07015 [Clostridiaceae bacterium]|nr:hypothetical protein [Clostridiaceae bacterium]
MPIKPIDMQIMMPRINEMSRIQNEEQQRIQASQQVAAQTTVKQFENNTRQVNSREETHNTAIREKQQNEKRQSNQQDKENNPDKEKTLQQREDNKQKPLGTVIDIRV